MSTKLTNDSDIYEKYIFRVKATFNIKHDFIVKLKDKKVLINNNRLLNMIFFNHLWRNVMRIYDLNGHKRHAWR